MIQLDLVVLVRARGRMIELELFAFGAKIQENYRVGLGCLLVPKYKRVIELVSVVFWFGNIGE